MTEEEYCLLSERMKEAGEILADYTGELMLLMDLINDLCVVFLSRTGAVMDVAEEERLQAVLRAVREAFSTGTELDAELLRPLEGRQEVCCDQWEPVLFSHGHSGAGGAGGSPGGDAAQDQPAALGQLLCAAGTPARGRESGGPGGA